MKTKPYCRYCGEPISKYTEATWVAKAPCTLPKPVPRTLYIDPDKLPRSKEDCERLTNNQVISVSYSYEFEDGVRTSRKYVACFTTWDGVTYVDPTFCRKDHARRFGIMVARDYPDIASKTYHDKMRKRAEQQQATEQSNDGADGVRRTAKAASDA